MHDVLLILRAITLLGGVPLQFQQFSETSAYGPQF